MREVPLQFGESGRSFGILTLPDVQHSDTSESSVFVFLSAGLLHRVGPHGLHVRLARELAQMGICSLRVDLAGRGESLPRPGLAYRQTVTADYKEIVSVLESQLGPMSIVLAGLCSGADNAIRLTIDDPRVVGMVLLDPVCDPDDGFKARARGYTMRALVRKLTTPSKYVPWLMRRIRGLTGHSRDADESVDNLSLRDIPPREQMRAAFEAIGERNGRVLSVFTGYSLQYCNEIGQMSRVLEVDGYERFCSELFWPHVEHSYPMESHRRLLIEEIKSWAAK